MRRPIPLKPTPLIPTDTDIQLNEDFKKGIGKLTLSQLLASITLDMDIQTSYEEHILNFLAWINYISEHYDSSNNRGLSQLTIEMAYCCHNIDKVAPLLKDGNPEIEIRSTLWMSNYLRLLIILVDHEQDLPEHHEKLLEFTKKVITYKKYFAILNCLLTEKILKKRKPEDPIVALHLAYLRTFIDQEKASIGFIDYKTKVNRDELASIYFSSREDFKKIIDILIQKRQFYYLFELTRYSTTITMFVYLKLIKKRVVDEYQIETGEKLHNTHFDEEYNDIDIYNRYGAYYYYPNLSLDAQLKQLEDHIEAAYLEIPSYENPPLSCQEPSDYFHFSSECRFFVNVETDDNREAVSKQNTLIWIKCLNDPHLRYTGPSVTLNWFAISRCFFYHHPPIFVHVQRLPSDERELLGSQIVVPIPFILRDYLRPSDWDAYQRLYETFSKLNQNNEERLRRTFDIFIIDNLIKFLNLYEILESKLCDFLLGFMAMSPLPLIRFFDSFELIKEDLYAFIKEIIYLHKNLNHRDMEEILLFTSNFQNLSDVFEKIDEHDKEEKISLRQAKKIVISLASKIKDKEFKEVKEIFRNYIIELYCEKIAINFKELLAMNIFDTLSFFLLNQLLIGRKKMKEDVYKRLFDEMLKVDLDATRSFETFTNDTNQSSETGRAIAVHNKQIKAELNEKNIKTDLAFHYTRTQKFSYSDEGAFDVNHCLITIWQDLELIESALLDLPSGEVATLKKTLANFKHQITKGKQQKICESNLTALKKMQSKANWNVLNKIVQMIAGIKRTNVEYPNTFIESIEHLEAHFKSLSTSSFTPGKKLKPMQRFRVEQWDKSKMTTLFLGNYLSCCLATNGAQFPALVQRRVDLATFAHMVIDENTEEPICGMWLAFAISDVGEAYVVANFIDIKSSYALDKKLRDLLVSQLLDYTAQFAFDIGAKEFLIRPLTYGLIPDSYFLSFPTMKMRIKKVGGYLSLATEEAKISQDRYNLDAMKLGEFYYYPKQRLQKEEDPNYSGTLFFHNVRANISTPRAGENASNSDSFTVMNH